MNQLTAINAWLTGHRTYISAAALVAVAVMGISGAVLPETVNQVGMLAIAAIGVFLRAAIGKADPRLQPFLIRALEATIAELTKPQPSSMDDEKAYELTRMAKRAMERVRTEDQPQSVSIPTNPVEDGTAGDASQDYSRPSGDGWKPSLLLLLALGLSLTAVGCQGAAPKPAPDPVKVIKPPKLVVQGPTTGIPGEPLHYDFSQTEGDDVRFAVMVEPDLQLLSNRKHVVHDSPKNNRAMLYGYPGTYTVRVSAYNSEGTQSWKTTLQVPGNPPSPKCPDPIIVPQPPPVLIVPQPVQPVTPSPIEPTPINPPPKPTDPPPKPTDPPPKPVDPTPQAGEFGLAPEVYRLAKSVQSPTRKAECEMLAAECERIANAEWPGETMTPMASAVVDVLNKLPAAWSVLGDKVRSTVTELYKSGAMTNRKAFARLLLELAPAFRAAAG